MKVEHINKVLADIQASVPAALRRNLFIESYRFPTLKMILETALKDPNLTPEQRKKYQLLYNNEATKKRVDINEKVAKMVDDFVGRKIDQAIKAGKLPARKDIGEIDFIKKLKEYDDQEKIS